MNEQDANQKQTNAPETDQRIRDAERRAELFRRIFEKSTAPSIEVVWF